mgnify:CR=1 FL=1
MESFQEEGMLARLIEKQCGSYWPMNAGDGEKLNLSCVGRALARWKECFARRPSTKRQPVFHGLPVDYLHTVEWSVFLYFVSNELGRSGDEQWASKVYFLNKIMCSVDWFYAIELPAHFWAEHPVGSVLGRAKYGDKLFVYQGTTVGGSPGNDETKYPELGSDVVLCANATVLGNTVIGSNAIVSANSCLVNETIPDNCIVFGHSPDIVIKVMEPERIKTKINFLLRGVPG